MFNERLYLDKCFGIFKKNTLLVNSQKIFGAFFLNLEPHFAGPSNNGVWIQKKTRLSQGGLPCLIRVFVVRMHILKKLEINIL